VNSDAFPRTRLEASLESRPHWWTSYRNSHRFAATQKRQWNINRDIAFQLQFSLESMRGNDVAALVGAFIQYQLVSDFSSLTNVCEQLTHRQAARNQRPSSYNARGNSRQANHPRQLLERFNKQPSVTIHARCLSQPCRKSRSVFSRSTTLAVREPERSTRQPTDA
jgi:hypothetical protein